MTASTRPSSVSRTSSLLSMVSGAGVRPMPGRSANSGSRAPMISRWSTPAPWSARRGVPLPCSTWCTGTPLTVESTGSTSWVERLRRSGAGPEPDAAESTHAGPGGSGGRGGTAEPSPAREAGRWAKMSPGTASRPYDGDDLGTGRVGRFPHPASVLCLDLEAGVGEEARESVDVQEAQAGTVHPQQNAVRVAGRFGERDDVAGDRFHLVPDADRP